MTTYWLWHQPIAEVDGLQAGEEGRGEYAWELDTLAMKIKVINRAEPGEVNDILNWMERAQVGDHWSFSGPFGHRANIIRGDHEPVTSRR
jgi:hypothetical protein